MKKSQKLSIYLIKDDYQNPNEILKINKAQQEKRIFFGDGLEGKLFVKKRTQSNLPPWTEIFRASVGSNAFHKTESLGAVFLCQCEGRHFVLSFGTGFHLLREWVIERDFGLKVTLNSVDPNKLRSIDKASYDHNPLNSRTQSMKEVDIYMLDLDSEMDMVYAVGGVSNIKDLGGYIAGKDSLSISLKLDIDDIGTILKLALEQYNKKIPDEFSWVGNVTKIRDKSVIDVIESQLDTMLKNRQHESIYLGEPEVTSWDTKLYSFDMYDKTPRYETLDLEKYIDYIDGELSLEILKKGTVNINNGDYERIKSWPLYRCVYTEIKIDGEHYILRNAEWYKVCEDFVQRVDDYLTKNLDDHKFKFPIYKERKESIYNESVSQSYPGIEKMDQQNIKIGGSYDKVEHCDLIKNGNEFVHVKYYSSSSTLSHLFAQGFVASEAFIADMDYRKKLNKKLPKTVKLKDYRDRPDPSSYTIVYAIATKKKLPSELPFFSKVSLKNAHKMLRTIGYGVEISRIEIDEVEINKKKIKAKKEKERKTAN